MSLGPYALLFEAESASFPVVLDDDGQIDQLRAYQAAGWVEAFIPQVVIGSDGTILQPPATLHSLTPVGRKIAEQARDSRAKYRRTLNGRTRFLSS